MAKSYPETTNPNAAQAFPYLVREVRSGRSTTFDPGFHVMHWHSDVQFLYAADGTVDVQTLHATYTVHPGEGLFLSRDVVHCIRAAQTAHYYNFIYPADQLHFAPGSPANDDLAPILDGTSLPVCPLTMETDWGRRALAQLQELAAFTEEQPDAYAANILVRLLDLVLLLRLHASLVQAARTDDANTARTKAVLQYIALHYADDITLADPAASAQCSKSACLRAFRTCMATTPYQYLIDYRLEQAALLLRQTQDPVASIAETVGFHHLSLFGKSFQKKKWALRQKRTAPQSSK